MIDFEIREKDVMVKAKGDRFYIPKETLELIYEKAQENSIHWKHLSLLHFNITWDTGYDSADVLPKAVLIPAAFTDENEITDYLCEVYDACGCGFDLKELG